MTSTAAAPLRCPVCQAPLRGVRTCGRCGGDLQPLMQVHASAWRLRRDGWLSLEAGDAKAAQAAAERPLALAASQSARRLLWLSQVLQQAAAVQEPPAGP